MPRRLQIPVRRQPAMKLGPQQSTEIVKLLQEGLGLHRQGRINDAKLIYEQILEKQKDHFDATQLLATVYHQQKQPDLALKYFERALSINKTNAAVFNNRGIALQELKRLDEALKSYDEALRIKPDYAEAYNNRGNALKDLKRLDEALKSYDEALRIKPDYAEAYWNKSLLLLLLGNFHEGWALYEWRLLKDETKASYYSGPCPAWRGEQNISGKRLLLQCEQGLGDTIQFMRYLPLVLARGADVIIETPKTLSPLFSALDLPVKLISKGSPLPPFDMHCPLMSLPHVFRTRAETVPNQVPYLAPTEDRLSKWRDHIGTNGFKIAICWQGSTKGKVDVGRSFPLHMFEAISKIDGVRLISLQKNDGVDQLQRLPVGMKVEVLPEDFDNGSNAFLDSAAVMRCVDLVITSDTSLTHLAGALGVKTWLLLKEVPDWRWMLDRSDSPWYPNHRLFRQTSRDDWAAVFREIEGELKVLLSNETPANRQGQGSAPMVPVSWGELIDKITILEIKQSLIAAESAQINIRKELSYLSNALLATSTVPDAVVSLKTKLYDVNRNLWEVEDAIREKDSKQEFDVNFIELARSVYTLNDERSQIKRSINCYMQSELIEEKSYKSFHGNDGSA